MHADWICETLDAQPRIKGLYQYLLKHPRLAIAGMWHRAELQFRRSASGFSMEPGRQAIQIYLNPEFSPETQLKELLKSVAREHLGKRVQMLERKVGVRAHGVTIRDQKSRWGSCSETGGISLNWRLLLIAPRLQDHVLLHELAHIRHFDHSRQFHGLLARLDPFARENEKDLHKAASKVFPLGR
jgi:predicted metal-dependent hydrolase